MDGPDDRVHLAMEACAGLRTTLVCGCGEGMEAAHPIIDIDLSRIGLGIADWQDSYWLRTPRLP